MLTASMAINKRLLGSVGTTTNYLLGGGTSIRLLLRKVDSIFLKDSFPEHQKEQKRYHQRIFWGVKKKASLSNVNFSSTIWWFKLCRAWIGRTLIIFILLHLSSNQWYTSPFMSNLGLKSWSLKPFLFCKVRNGITQAKKVSYRRWEMLSCFPWLKVLKHEKSER